MISNNQPLFNKRPLSREELTQVAKEIRRDILSMIYEAKSGHPGGTLSLVELLSYLFFNVIQRTKDNANDANRDRFLLSKGHGIPTVYAIFKQLGMLTHEDLMSFRKLGSRLQGHPDFARFPEVEVSTGSLGQGISLAQGMALAGKLDQKNYHVYCLIGDGEMQEGQVWETFMSAAHYQLDTLCVILDNNKAQIDGYVKDVMNINPIADKLLAFGWNVISIDGHDWNQISHAYQQAKDCKGKPTFILAETIKGKGVSFMENKVEWHGVAPNKEQLDQAFLELA